jgi:hypothetical protein
VPPAAGEETKAKASLALGSSGGSSSAVEKETQEKTTVLSIYF